MMPPPPDLIGREFSRLRVLGRSAKREPASGRTARQRGWTLPLWECLCDPELGGCGKIVAVTTARLTSGNTESCGCLQRDHAKTIGRKAISHATRKHCVGCGVLFLGTHKQKYHNRDCKERSKLADWTGRHCAACGRRIPDGVRTGRRPDYCDRACKRLVAERRQAITEVAAVAAELQQRSQS